MQQLIGFSFNLVCVFFQNVLAHSNFGQKWTTATTNLHEELYVFLQAEVSGRVAGLQATLVGMVTAVT
jgi:hypothetical protein